MWIFDDPFAFVFLSSLVAAVASVIGFHIDRQRQGKAAERSVAEHVSASGPFVEEKRDTKTEHFREKEDMPTGSGTLEFVSGRGFEKGFEEGKEEGRAEAGKEVQRNIAMRMLRDGTLSEKKIAEYLGLTTDEVEQIKQEKGRRA